MDDDARILALLHALDHLPGPEHLEFPDGFDCRLAKARATRLKDPLAADFGQACPLDDQIQDASYSFAIAIPAEAAETGVPVGVQLSNYGSLAVVTTPGPDSHADVDHAVQEGALSTADRSRIEAALRGLGYTLVFPRLLHQPYDGVTRLADFSVGYGPYRGRATWRTRYFEYP